jgi:DnaJ-domain-containing protein 1
MLLPGRLKTSTLGDILGAVHRAGATGALELVEDRGRTHWVHVAAGLVISVEIDGAAPSLAEILRRDHEVDDDVLRRSLLRAMASRRLHGEVLVAEFHLSPAVVGNALRRQLAVRLSRLEQIADARISFRVALRSPREALRTRPLAPTEFLQGRRRARERVLPVQANVPDEPSAWRVLGLAPGADEVEIKRAYRRLARSVHPDLHPGVSDDERRVLQERFSEITQAYRSLVA